MSGTGQQRPNRVYARRTFRHIVEDNGIGREGLRDAVIFDGMEPGAAKALGRQLRRVRFPRDHIVFAQGEPGDRLYIITSGTV